MKLVFPSVEYKGSFIEAVKEVLKEPNDSQRYILYRRHSVAELQNNFETLLEHEKDKREGRNLAAGRVPSTDYWLVDNSEFIGRISIRHRLNDNLLAIGGHIGYDIRPSKRGQGYGNKILELGLSKARELGIDRILVTCDVTNVPSRKIIEKNGGKLENKVPNPETGTEKLRFWINIP